MNIASLRKVFWWGMIGGHVILAFAFFSGLAIFFSVKIAFWIDLVALPIFLILYTIFRFVKQHRKLVDVLRLLFAVGIICFTYYVNQVEPYDLQIREEIVIDNRFTQELVLVHISDIQSDGIGAYESGVFDSIASLNPDLIVHTGDLVQMHNVKEQQEQLERLSALFSKLKPRYGIYNVIGDTDIDQLQRSMEFDRKSGVVTLVDENSAVIETLHGIDIQLTGFSLDGSRFEDESLAPLVANVDEGNFNLLIGHAPDFVLYHDISKYSLCLAGHTHGGQVRLPGVGPVITMSNVPNDWAYGLNDVDGVPLNVTAGIGAEHASKLPSIRLNCPPEIVVIRIGPG